MRKYAFCWLLLSLIASQTAQAAGGTLTSNTVWSPSLGTIMVYSNVVIPNGISLTIEAGTLVQFSSGISIQVQAGGSIDIEGSSTNRVQLQPMASANWGTISASGANSSVIVRFAELNRGGINLNNRAPALIEDTYVHDYGSAIVGNTAGFITMRRIHVKNYSETIFNSGTVILAEDSLFENINTASGDALEIQNGPPGSIIRRCTFRHGTLNNTDALDFNGSTNVVVQDCLIYDFSDKGVSIGTALSATDPPAKGIVVTNCLFYSVDSAVAVKDFSTASLYNSTIVRCPFGVKLYEKYSPYNLTTGGGRFTNGYNNIIWGNTTFVNPLTNGSVMQFTYSDLQSNVAGAGNIQSDPLFLNSNVAQLDTRLAANSPAIGTGYGGANMGATYPVGAPMAPSHPRIESVGLPGGMPQLHFWADGGKTYSVQFTDSLTNGWSLLAPVSAQTLPRLVEITDTNVLNSARFYRVTTP